MIRDKGSRFEIRSRDFIIIPSIIAENRVSVFAVSLRVPVEKVYRRDF